MERRFKEGFEKINTPILPDRVAAVKGPAKICALDPLKTAERAIQAAKTDAPLAPG